MGRRPARSLLLLLAGLMVAAPASARLARSDQAMVDYVQGRLAQASQHYDVAAGLYAEALKAEADQVAERRAFDVAMISGDEKGVARLGRAIHLRPEPEARTSLGDSVIALARASLAARRGDWSAYDKAVADFSAPGRGGESGRMLATLLEAWGEAADGDLDAALQLSDPAGASGVARSYLQEHRAHLLSYGKRWPEAARAYGELISSGAGNVSRLRIAAASTMLMSAPTDPQAREEAILLLANGPGHDPQLEAVRARMTANPRIGGRQLGYLVDSPQRGVALIFVRLAADLAREHAAGAAINFARLATFADPALPDGWLVVADALSVAERYDLALQALQSVPKQRPWAELAAARRVATLAQAGRTDEARQLLRDAAERPGASVSDWVQLAELERQSEHSEAAVDAYGQALALLPAEDEAARAQLYFLRGTANERAGNWPRAEEDLRAAVDMQDDNPVFLNYLGYSILEHGDGRGDDLAEARQLIARAYEIAPENGAITDSMGWAEYRLGHHAEAVRLLEEAQSAEPADPTVADHLGDALWAVGRRIEARYSWRSAAALSPGPELAAAIARKLDFGPDAPPRAE